MIPASGCGKSLKEMKDITAVIFGFGIWRELAQAATKGEADPPDEQCDAEKVRHRCAYQAHAQPSSTCSSRSRHATFIPFVTVTGSLLPASPATPTQHQFTLVLQTKNLHRQEQAPKVCMLSSDGMR